MTAPRIDCSPELYIRITTTLQHAITGQKLFYGDTLSDLVRRHCPDLHDIAAEEGCVLVLDDDKESLKRKIPEIRFDVIKATRQ